MLATAWKPNCSRIQGNTDLKWVTQSTQFGLGCLCIQSKCGRIGTRKNPNRVTFHAVTALSKVIFKQKNKTVRKNYNLEVYLRTVIFETYKASGKNL